MTTRNIKTSYVVFVILLIACSISLNILALNKPVKFRRLTTKDGLSQNRVFDILQDQDGFIWIGTEDGLNRYDGYNFEIFKRIPGDTLSLSDNFATVLYVTRDGTLWSGGNFEGLNKFNSAAKTFLSYKHVHSDPNSISDNFLNSISEDERGNLWIGTANNGFDYMFVKEGKFAHMINILPRDYPLQKDEIYFVYQDKKNNLWIGSEGKIHYFKIDYSENGIPQLQPIQLKNQNISSAALSIHEDLDNNIWIGTAGNGIYQFDRENKIFNKFEVKDGKSSVELIDIRDIASDGIGNLWIGGTPRMTRSTIDYNAISGLIKINILSRDVQKFVNDPKNEESLSNNRVLSVFIDKTGVLWVGTNLGGVNVYDKSVTKFSIFKASPLENNKLKSPTRGFYLDKDNVLWIASQGDGLVSYNRNTDQYKFFKYDANNLTSISSNFVTSLYDDGEYLWLGTFRGLNRFDKKTKSFKRFYVDSSDPNSRINSVNYNILEIDKYPGFIWFGTNGSGLVRFNKKDFSIKSYTYDPEVETGLNNRANFVRTVWYSDTRPNELWTGTTNGINILNLDDETFRYYNHDPNDSTSLSHPNVMHFYEDERGYIWIATYGGGLNRFDPNSDVFLRFTEGNSGLPNNGVYGTLPDDNGFLWISTNNGITKLNPEKFQFRNYTVDDGLQSEEFNGGSYYKAYNGEMFFGGINGYNSFFPSEVVDNKFIPKIVITDVKIFNESIRVGENSPLKQQITKADEIELESWQNDISFEYVAIHYSNPSKNKYAFKLENYEKDWRYVDNIRIATYTNLDPGEYVFRVKGSNNDGLWNEEGKSIRLVIHPPWWKTNMAYASYAFIFLFGLLSADRIQKARIKRIEQRKAQLALLEAENKRKSVELEEARNLQLSMLPKSLPNLPNLDVAVYMNTATEVGGDYYDFHVHPDGTLTVILGDATGHGMMSGMMVSIMKSLFMSDRSNKDLKPFLQNANTAIKDMQLGRLMMALTCVQFAGENIRLSNAGMPSLFIYRASEKTAEEIAINNLPLGAIKDFEYEIKNSSISTGDTLLLMSDGFAELTNNKEEMIGYLQTKKLFEEVAEKNPEDIIHHLKEKGNAWREGRENEDDITFIVVKVK